MARTITEIYDEMVAEKQSMPTLQGLQPAIDHSQTLLNDLTSKSKVAIWRLLFFVVAVAIWVHEVIFDKHKAEIEARANEVIPGTAKWYRDQCMLFQYGDPLVYLNRIYQYATIDETKQIIKRTAVIEANGQVRIKVAKLANGLPVPLSTSELTAFSAYVNQIKFAGTNIAIISHPADKLKISYDVTYNPLVMNGNGELIENTSIKPVEDAINNYIQNLPFNGILNLTKLTDAVQMAKGVIDPVLNSAEATYGNLAYAPILKNYNANAGYMEIDINFPLDQQINYIPANV